MGSFLEMKVMMAIYLGGSSGIRWIKFQGLQDDHRGLYDLSNGYRIIPCGYQSGLLKCDRRCLLMIVLFLTMRFNRGKGRTE